MGADGGERLSPLRVAVLGGGAREETRSGPGGDPGSRLPRSAATWGTSVYELGTNFVVAVAVLFFKSSVCF